VNEFVLNHVFSFPTAVFKGADEKIYQFGPAGLPAVRVFLRTAAGQANNLF